MRIGFGNKQNQTVIALMEDLIHKIKDLEREALRLKQHESSLGKAPPPQQPLLRQWSLEKNPQQQQQSPLRPTAARSLQILEKGLGSHSAVTIAPRSLEVEGCRSRLKGMETETGWRRSRPRLDAGLEGSLWC